MATRQDVNLNPIILGLKETGIRLASFQRVLLTTNHCLIKSGSLKTIPNSSHHAKLTY